MGLRERQLTGCSLLLLCLTIIIIETITGSEDSVKWAVLTKSSKPEMTDYGAVKYITSEDKLNL